MLAFNRKKIAKTETFQWTTFIIKTRTKERNNIIGAKLWLNIWRIGFCSVGYITLLPKFFFNF